MQKKSAAGNILRYVFVRIYSNEELLAFLERQLKDGLVIDHCKGNFLFFRRWHIKDARLCLVSTVCSKRKAEEDDEVQEYIDIAKRQGWQLLCVGDYESLLPVRRRLYFYTSDPEAKPLDGDEVIDFQNAHRAYHSTLRSSIGWVVLAALALVSTVPFMLADGVNAAMLVLNAALLAAACAAMSLCMNRKKLFNHVTKNAPAQKDSHLHLRRLEKFQLGTMAATAAGMLLLLFS